MNVQELTDTELNRAMVWLYPPKEPVYRCECSQGYHILEIYGCPFDYLADWDRTMPLAFENNLNVDFYNGSTHYTRYEGEEVGLPEASSIGMPNPLRAICEVLVMIKSDRPL